MYSEIWVYKERKRRSRLQIQVDVMKACREPNIPTRIMYASNISWRMLQGILNELQEKGLIEFKGRKTSLNGDRNGRIAGIYEATEKGRSLLQGIAALEKVWGESF